MHDNFFRIKTLEMHSNLQWDDRYEFSHVVACYYKRVENKATLIEWGNSSLRNQIQNSAVCDFRMAGDHRTRLSLLSDRVEDVCSGARH